jgi:hypothetical protein
MIDDLATASPSRTGRFYEVEPDVGHRFRLVAVAEIGLVVGLIVQLSTILRTPSW